MILIQGRHSFSSNLICAIITFLILFSPLIYGSVTPLSTAFLEITSFLVLAIFLLRALRNNEVSFVKAPLLLLFSFVILVIFQLFPLFGPVLSLLSPHTMSLYNDFMANKELYYTLSIYNEATFGMLLQLLSYLAIFFVVLNYVNTVKKGRFLAVVIIAAGFIYALYGIVFMQKLSYPKMRSFSTFTNANHFAAYMEMIIPLTVSYSLLVSSKSKRLLFAFIATVQILALFLSLSRAGIICFCFSLLIYFFLLKIKRPIKKTISVIVILFLFLSLFFGLVGLGAVTEKLGTIFTSQDLRYRLDMTGDSLRIIKDYPIFGTGMGTLGAIFNKYSSVKGIHSFAHNEPVQLAAETGILGFLLVALFLLIYLYKVFRVWLKRRNPYASYIALGMLIGIFSLIAHSSFDFFLHVPAVALLFFIILALVYRVVHAREFENLSLAPEIRLTLTKPVKLISAAVLCVSFISLECVVLKRYRAEAIFDNVNNRRIPENSTGAVIGYKKSLRDIERAISLNPYNSLYLNKKADLLFEIAGKEDLMPYLNIVGNFQGRDEMLAAAEKFYKKAINASPTRAGFHLRLGTLYSFMNSREEAKKEFNQALLLDPRNSDIESEAKK